MFQQWWERYVFWVTPGSCPSTKWRSPAKMLRNKAHYFHSFPNSRYKALLFFFYLKTAGDKTIIINVLLDDVLSMINYKFGTELYLGLIYCLYGQFYYSSKVSPFTSNERIDVRSLVFKDLSLICEFDSHCVLYSSVLLPHLSYI